MQSQTKKQAKNIAKNAQSCIVNKSKKIESNKTKTKRPKAKNLTTKLVIITKQRDIAKN